MSLIEKFIESARADLAHYLVLAEETGQVHFQREAREARANLEALESLKRIPA